MRAVLASVGSRGDVQPMLALALALRARGHAPVVCAPPEAGEWVRGRGIEFHPVGSNMKDFMTRNAAATGNALRGARAMEEFLRAEARLHFEQLWEAAQGAELVVAAGPQLSAGSVAEKLGVPYRSVSYAPILYETAHHPPVMVPWQRLPRWANRLAWRLFHTFFHRTFLSIVNAERARLGLPSVHSLVRPAPKSRKCDRAHEPRKRCRVGDRAHGAHVAPWLRRGAANPHAHPAARALLPPGSGMSEEENHMSQIACVPSEEARSVAALFEGTRPEPLWRRLWRALAGGAAQRPARRLPRKHPRFETAFQVILLQVNGKTARAKVRDLSMGGMRVRPLATLRPGDVVRVRFGAPWGVEARARVAWATSQEAGLEFVLHPRAEAGIRKVIHAAERSAT